MASTSGSTGTAGTATISILDPRGKLLTPEQLAALLSNDEDNPVSVRTLQDWRTDGLGPDFVTLSAKMIRYRVYDVDSWIASKVRTNRAARAAA